MLDMKSLKYPVFALILVLAVSGGCARAARDTTGFAVLDSATVDASFQDTWQGVKAVLREMELDIYTRDKRGSFVAYTPIKRKFKVWTPQRTEVRVTLEKVSSEATRVNVEIIDQVYGTTLLTYPDWHDRKSTDTATAAKILDAVKVKLS